MVIKTQDVRRFASHRTAPRRQPLPVFYTREQLDDLCERIIVGFCMERYAQELNPIPTDALLQLLEEHAHDVDQTTCKGKAVPKGLRLADPLARR